MTTETFTTPLYGTEFTLMAYSNQEEFQEHFKGDRKIQDLTTYDGAVFYSGDDLYIVFDVSNGKPTPGIIAHEAKHLVNNIFIHINHKLSRWNDEPEAYLLKWVVDVIHEFLGKATIANLE